MGHPDVEGFGWVGQPPLLLAILILGIRGPTGHSPIGSRHIAFRSSWDHLPPRLVLVWWYEPNAESRRIACSTSHYPAGKCPPVYPLDGAGAPGLPPASPGVLATAPIGGAGLLPDVESRSPDRSSPTGGQLAATLKQTHGRFAAWWNTLSTHTGRPLGSEEFVGSLEQAMRRKLAPERAGRRPRREDASEQPVQKIATQRQKYQCNLLDSVTPGLRNFSP